MNKSAAAPDIAQKAQAPSPRLTPTARAILDYLESVGDKPVTKAAIARELGRCEKTVDRLVANLRSNGLLQVEEHWADNGGQLPNTYSVSR